MTNKEKKNETRVERFKIERLSTVGLTSGSNRVDGPQERFSKKNLPFENFKVPTIG
jgi:hypothetical protein